MDHRGERVSAIRPHGPWKARELFHFELSRRLPCRVFPAERRALVRALVEGDAPDQLVRAVRALPADGTYRDAREVAAALPLEPRHVPHERE